MEDDMFHPETFLVSVMFQAPPILFQNASHIGRGLCNEEFPMDSPES